MTFRQATRSTTLSTTMLARAILPAFAVLALASGSALAAGPGQSPAERQLAHQQAAPEQPAQQLAQQQVSFESWLAEFRQRARSQGISEATLDAAFRGVQPIERIIELDRRQPEFTQTFWSYLDARVSERRIERGREMLREHRDLLQPIADRYGVPAHYIVSFWGLETNYGDYMGDFRVVDALATLAYDPRRRDFFSEELMHALRILEEGHVTADDMVGSWAGAMGHMQFMPSTFNAYAMDATGDGRQDIWTTLPDAFASAANFLSSIGWKAGEAWGREVRLPQGFDNWDAADLGERRSLTAWADMGVTAADGGALPMADMEASLILPGGYEGPAFLVYDNFRAIMRWNRSISYAIAVGHLADRIRDRPPLVAERPADDRAMSREEVEEMQRLLSQQGHDAGPADGIVGAQTRAALRAFQRSRGKPADGYPTPSLLESLRAAAG